MPKGILSSDRRKRKMSYITGANISSECRWSLVHPPSIRVLINHKNDGIIYIGRDCW